ncbi:MAG: FAD-dependent oxidoreductase, partial [Myxococcota bacterium]
AWLDDVGVYARPAADGWWVSGCDEAVSFPDGPGTRLEAGASAHALVSSKIRRLLPALADAPHDGGWSGLRTFAPDRRPVLGEDPELPGLWWVTGLGGYGLTGGPAAAEAVAAWIDGRDTPWLGRDAVSPGRPYPRRWSIRPDGDAARSELIDVGLDRGTGGRASIG